MEFKNTSTHELEKLRDDVLRELIDRNPHNGQAQSKTFAYTNKIPQPMSPEEVLTKIFSYHDDPRKIPNYIAIRTAAKHFAEVILQNAPGCADRTRALNMVRDSVMLANAAVALDGVSFNSI